MGRTKTAFDLLAEDEQRSLRAAKLSRVEKRSSFKAPDEILLNVFGGPTRSGANVSPDTASSLPVVYACVGVLARDIAKLPLKLYKKTADGREEATDHPLFNVLHSQPNGNQTSYEWREMMQGHLALRGNAYSRIIRDQFFDVVGLEPLHPCEVSPVKLTSGIIVYDYEGRRLTSNDILHLRSRSTDGVCGKSPVQVLRESIGLGLAMQQHAAAGFSNGNKYPGILKAPPVLKDDQLKTVKKQWKEQTAGADNAGSNPILGGGLDWISVGMSNTDAQFIEGQKFSAEELASCWGIPLTKLGRGEKSSTYASVEQFMIAYVGDTLAPWTTNWAQRLNTLLSEADRRAGYYFAFNLKALMAGDAASRAAYYKTMREIRAITINEIRAAEEMNDLPDNIGDNPRENFNGQGGGNVDAKQPANAEDSQ